MSQENIPEKHKQRIASVSGLVQEFCFLILHASPYQIRAHLDGTTIIYGTWSERAYLNVIKDDIVLLENVLAAQKVCTRLLGYNDIGEGDPIIKIEMEPWFYSYP